MLDARLSAFYGDAQILHDVNLRVEAGERVAVLGRNGAGKSTLLKSLMGMGPIVDGSIRFDTVDIQNETVHKRARMGMAFVPEDRRIYSHLTVLENVELAARAVGRPQAEAMAALQQFDILSPLVGRYGNQLSGGQQQLLAVCRALVVRPKLMMLDEPTEGLAPVIVEDMARLVVKVCEETGSALLLCEQNLWFSKRCTSRVYLMDVGTLVFQGSWSEFDADPSLQRRYLSV